MRTVLQLPVAALTAVCISVPAAGAPMVHAASASPGAATHVSTADVSLAAARTDLRLVFARVGEQPALGTAIAGAAAKPKLEILALPPTAAAEVATNGAGAVPAAVVEAGRTAATKILADANEASLSTVTAAATPTDNVLSRALQGVWNFGLWTGSSSVPPLPAGFDTKTYTSILKVLSNLVNVGLLPFTVANQVLQGQWSAIPTNITNTLNTFSTSLGRLPGSFQETLNWIINGTVPTATATTASALAATPGTTSTAAATASATDNVLSRALQGVWNFGLWTGSSSVPPLPAGFDTKTYTSILKVLSNLVNVGLLPFTVANQVLQGQWSAIPTNITNTLNTFSTSLGRLPGSFQETLNWIINGTVPTATATTAGAVLATPAANAAVSPNATAAATATGNVLSRALQGAWNIGLWTGSSSVPPLPAGFDTKTYTSILKVVSNLVNVGLLPFTVVNQALQGQWSAIPTNITNTLNTFSTSLGRLPGSIGQTLHWIVTGTATTATAVKPTTLAAGATTAAAGATTADAVTGKGAKNPTETSTGTKSTDGAGTGTDGAGTGTTGGTETGGTETGSTNTGAAGGTKESSGTESGATGGSTAGAPGDTKPGDTKAGDSKTGDDKSGDAAADTTKDTTKDTAKDTTKGSTTGKHSAGSGTYGRHARQDDDSDSSASASSGTSTTSSTGGRHRKPEGSSSTGSTGSSSSSTGGEHSSAA